MKAVAAGSVSVSGFAGGGGSRRPNNSEATLAVLQEIKARTTRPDHMKPCQDLSFGAKWRANMDMTYGGLYGILTNRDIESALKYLTWRGGIQPISSYITATRGTTGFLSWTGTQIKVLATGKFSVSGATTGGVLAAKHTLLVSGYSLPAYIAGTSIGSAYQAWTAPCSHFGGYL